MQKTKFIILMRVRAGLSRLTPPLLCAAFAAAAPMGAWGQPADYRISAENDANFPPPPPAAADGAGFLPPAEDSAPAEPAMAAAPPPAPAAAESDGRGALWPSVAAAEAEAIKRDAAPADTAWQQNVQQLQSEIDNLKTRLAALEAKQAFPPAGGNAAPAAPAAENGDEDVSAEAVPAALSADALYRHGQDLMAAQHFGQAAAVWRIFGQRFGDDPRAAQAAFQLGECYYARGLYGKAAENYLNVRTKYKNAPIIPQNLLKLAQSMANLQDNQTACAALEQLAKHYPAADPEILRQGAEASARLQCP